MSLGILGAGSHDIIALITQADLLLRVNRGVLRAIFWSSGWMGEVAWILILGSISVGKQKSSGTRIVPKETDEEKFFESDTMHKILLYRSLSVPICRIRVPTSPPLNHSIRKLRLERTPRRQGGLPACLVAPTANCPKAIWE